MEKSGIEHRKIHLLCPNENAEIERYHRTQRKLIDPTEAYDYMALIELVNERVHYYNHERYHSAIGYVTLYAMYSNKAEAVLES